MITLGPFAQSREEGSCPAYGDDLPGPVPSALVSTRKKPVDVVALLRLVGPRSDVVLGDGLALDRLHAQSAIRNVEGVEMCRAVGPVPRPHLSADGTSFMTTLPWTTAPASRRVAGQVSAGDPQVASE